MVAIIFGVVMAGLVGLVAVFLLLRLRQRLAPFERTFESAAVGITHTALNGKWLRVNDRMLEITGYSREELMQMSYQDLTLESDRTMDARVNRQIVDGGHAVHHGHADIHDHEVGRMGIDDVERLAPVSGFEDSDLQIGKALHQLPALKPLIIDDQNRTSVRPRRDRIVICEGHSS